MDRPFHRARSHEEATAWDRRQVWSLTPEERLEIARELQERYYGKENPD